MDAQLRAAMSVGAPLYNAGDVAGCATTYRVTAQQLLATNLAPVAAARLRAALQEADAAKSDDAAAWTLRHAFDALLSTATPATLLEFRHTLPSGMTFKENYIYLHDTCFVHPQFVLFYSSLAMTLAAQPHAFELFAAKGYHSNILVFRQAFIKRCGRKYHRNFTKAEALSMELHHHVERIGRTFLNRNHPYVSHIFGERVGAGDFDMYGTGLNRTLMYYPEMGVYKLILMGKHGDIQGHIVGQGTTV